MGRTKFTVRVDDEAMRAAKRYAELHGTTVTNLVNEFFHSLEGGAEPGKSTPVLDELTGSLPANASVEEYQEYLESKYGSRNR